MSDLWAKVDLSVNYEVSWPVATPSTVNDESNILEIINGQTYLITISNTVLQTPGTPGTPSLPLPPGTGATQFSTETQNGSVVYNSPFYLPWTPVGSGKAVSPSFNLASVNNVTPNNTGYLNFPNEIQEYDGSGRFIYANLLTPLDVSATTIVPTGQNPTSYIPNFYAPTETSPQALSLDSGISATGEIYYPQYIWVDLGPASSPGQLSGNIALSAATEHVALPANTTIATFTDTNPSDAANGFTATIIWGDTTTSTGTITGSNGSFVVTGGHTYADEGTAPVSVTITRTADNAQISPSASVVVGENDALTGNGTTINTDTSLGVSGTLATFTDTDTVSPASDFTASINWGDGTTSTGTVSRSNGTFQVSGSHTYAPGTTGQDAVAVTLTDKSPGTATATANTTVVLPPTVTIHDAADLEDGAPGSSGTASFTVTLDHASTTDLTFYVNVNPANTTMLDTAQLKGDIGSYSPLFTIPAYTTTATLQIPLVGDTQIEPKEQFVVQLTPTAGENVLLGAGDVTWTNGSPIPGTAIGTILGDGNLATNVGITGLAQSLAGLGLPQTEQDLLVGDLTADLDAAVTRIENALGGIAGSIPKFDIKVSTANLASDVSADTSPVFSYTYPIQGQPVYLPNTLVEHLTNGALDPSGPDILLTLSTNSQDGVLTWFSGQSNVDVVTLLTHELLHGMGFGSGYGAHSGLAGNPQTIWDSFLVPPNNSHNGYSFQVTPQSNVPLITDDNGILVPGYDHIAASDLMDPYVGTAGNQYAMFNESISPLDIAILKDIGYGTTAPSWFHSASKLVFSPTANVPPDASTQPDAPPTSPPSLDNTVALFNQSIAAGFSDQPQNGVLNTNPLSQVVTNEEQFLAQPHHV
jgi:hypothetical protein